MTFPLVIESRDGHRIWSIVERPGHYVCAGLRKDGSGWTVAGHATFLSSEAAIAFCEALCGLARKERTDA